MWYRDETPIACSEMMFHRLEIYGGFIPLWFVSVLFEYEDLTGLFYHILCKTSVRNSYCTLYHDNYEFLKITISPLFLMIRVDDLFCIWHRKYFPSKWHNPKFKVISPDYNLELQFLFKDRLSVKDWPVHVLYFTCSHGLPLFLCRYLKSAHVHYHGVLMYSMRCTWHTGYFLI